MTFREVESSIALFKEAERQTPEVSVDGGFCPFIVPTKNEDKKDDGRTFVFFFTEITKDKMK